MEKTRQEQSRGASLAEAASNTAIGFCFALVAQSVILPAFGIIVSAGTHVGLAASFTAVSVLRNYLVRRYFEGRIR